MRLMLMDEGWTDVAVQAGFAALDHYGPKIWDWLTQTPDTPT